VLNFWERLATKTLRNKAKELHRKGKTVDEIVELFMAKDDVMRGLSALGIGRERLMLIVEEEVKKEKR